MFECHHCSSLVLFLHRIQFLCVIVHAPFWKPNCGEIENKIRHFSYSSGKWCAIEESHIQTDSDAYRRQYHLRVDWKFWHRHMVPCLWTDGIWCYLEFYTADLVARAEQKWSLLLCLNKWIEIIHESRRFDVWFLLLILTGIRVKLQLAVEVINKASPRNDFSMRIV